MKEYQTPHKVSARSSENRNGRFKDFPSKKSNTNKITTKSLNSTFTSVSEDSPISEISYANHNEEDVTTFLLDEPSTVTLLPSVVIPSRKITDTTEISSTNCFSAIELESSKFDSVEAEIAVNFLKNVKPVILNSVNAAPQYRKLMNEIIEYVIQLHDLHASTLPEDRDHLAQVLSAKNKLLFICAFIWIIGLAFVLFFTLDNHSPYNGPTPT